MIACSPSGDSQGGLLDFGMALGVAHGQIEQAGNLVLFPDPGLAGALFWQQGRGDQREAVIALALNADGGGHVDNDLFGFARTKGDKSRAETDPVGGRCVTVTGWCELDLAAFVEGPVGQAERQRNRVFLMHIAKIDHLSLAIAGLN